MEKIRIVGISFFIILACQAQYLERRCSTTNDIDAILDVRLFEEPGWNRYYSVLVKTCNSLWLESQTNDVSALRRHVFHKVLELPVSTNMFRAEGHLEDKAMWVTQLAERWWSNGVLGESDAFGMLASAAGVCRVSTNDLEAARIVAGEKDRALGWVPGRARVWGSPACANLRAWNNECRRREYWNRQVEEYRRKMVMACIRGLNVLWKDVDAGEREKRIKEVVESHGLSMPTTSQEQLR